MLVINPVLYPGTSEAALSEGMIKFSQKSIYLKLS